MMNIMYLLNSAYFGARNFISNEVKRIKEDESGMELLQVVLIILFVVIIASVLWAFLGEYLTELLESIFGERPDPGQGDITNPF